MPLKIEQVPVEKLTFDPSNARKHSDANLAAIAESLKQFGQRKPIVVTADGVIVAGNGTVEAARLLGLTDVDVVRVPKDWDSDRVKAFALADNRTAELAEWNPEVLSGQLLELEQAGFDIEALGFESVAVDDMEQAAEIVEDELPVDVVSRVAPGDVWILGKHRVMCGDSTKPDDVARLLNGEVAQLLHADPPYGMGKENDGVANDNLYKEKLDVFQIDWWKTFRPYLNDNASAYIWGTAPDLWRLWYASGFSQLEPMTFKNEIVWAKNQVIGQSSGSHRMFPTGSERCIFFMLGVQGFNTNADHYWEGWEPIRLYLCSERDKAGFTNSQMNQLCGKQNMTQAAFTKGGFRLILEEDYDKLREASNGKAFTKNYADLKKDYEKLKNGQDELRESFYSTRAYFDNTHENMTDVWHYDTVHGEERHGHATPKPVPMMGRIMRSSLPADGLCLEPFAGSGATLIGAEQTGRRCFTMELNPEYCDVVIQRWENLTGEKAVLENASR